MQKYGSASSFSLREACVIAFLPEEGGPRSGGRSTVGRGLAPAAYPTCHPERSRRVPETDLPSALYHMGACRNTVLQAPFLYVRLSLWEISCGAGERDGGRNHCLRCSTLYSSLRFVPRHLSRWERHDSSTAIAPPPPASLDAISLRRCIIWELAEIRFCKLLFST